MVICSFSGVQYLHLLYAIALARASYVPQMITFLLTSPSIIFELMEKGGSRMILYDPVFESLTADCPFPKMPLSSFESLPAVSDNTTLPNVEGVPSGSDVCTLYLTLGSTSGSPKVVPLTQNFLSTYYKSQFGTWLGEEHLDTQKVFLARGSVCSVASIIRMYSPAASLPQRLN